MACPELGRGAAGRPAGAIAAARCARAGTAFWKGWPLAVAPPGASIVTLVMLVTFVTRVSLIVVLWLLTSTLPRTRMPTLTTGGALTTTAGGVPRGAGTMRPAREPGGGGTNTPC